MAEIEYMLIKERAAERVKIAKGNKKMGRPKRILNQTEMGVLKDYLEGFNKFWIADWQSGDVLDFYGSVLCGVCTVIGVAWTIRYTHMQFSEEVRNNSLPYIAVTLLEVKGKINIASLLAGIQLSDNRTNDDKVTYGLEEYLLKEMYIVIEKGKVEYRKNLNKRYNLLKLNEMEIEKMLRYELKMLKQEQKGNYKFNGVVPVATRNFALTFGEEWREIVLRALHKINTEQKKPDYLQRFDYGDKGFWVIADFKEGARLEDYEGIDYFYVTFLMPEDY